MLRRGAQRGRAASCIAACGVADQGWREGGAGTVVSGGNPALPALVRSAAGGPVKHPRLVHLSMRVHHVEQVMCGPCALEPLPAAPPDHARIDAERLRCLRWNGHYDKAYKALDRSPGWSKDAAILAEPGVGEGRAPGRALHGAAQLRREQRGRTGRLRPAQGDRWNRGRGSTSPNAVSGVDVQKLSHRVDRNLTVRRTTV